LIKAKNRIGILRKELVSEPNKVGEEVDAMEALKLDEVFDCRSGPG